MIDDGKRTFFIHGSYTFAISQSYIKQCTNFQSQLLFDAFTILEFQARMLNPQKCGLLGHLTERCYMLNTIIVVKTLTGEYIHEHISWNKVFEEIIFV